MKNSDVLQYYNIDLIHKNWILYTKAKHRKSRSLVVRQKVIKIRILTVFVALSC